MRTALHGALRVVTNRWVIALLLVVLGTGYVLLRTFTYGLQRFDEGILLNATSFLANGVIPPGDAYQPYGPAYAVFGFRDFRSQPRNWDLPAQPA